MIRIMKKITVLACASLVALTGCGASSTATSGSSPTPTPSARETIEAAGHSPRLAITHDGGVQVLDAAKGTVLGDYPMDGYLRLNQAGDGRHLLVSQGDHFRVLDTGTWSRRHADHYHAWKTTPRVEDYAFDGKHPGHAVVHAGRTALFYDGEGRVEWFDPEVMSVEKPATHQVELPAAHHGVAILREDDTLIHTVGTETRRTGIAVQDSHGKQLAANADCPGVHGEAAVQGAVVVGCEDGVLVVKGNTISKVQAPDAYGRIGNQAGSEHSPVTLGDYKVDKQAELERPTRVSLVDSRTNTLRLVETGASYSFRSLGRGPEGEGLVLGTDGKLRQIDPNSGRITRQLAVVKAWQEPTDWHQPRPTLYVQGHTAWVSEPATKELHAVDLDTMAVTRSIQLTTVPDEVNGSLG